MTQSLSLIGSLPQVGIRPTIDGRRQGVRESLEAKTMGMAHAVARLISDTLRYPDGSPVQCVIADTCIGGVAEAALCEEKFQRTGVGLSITVTPCWCYGTETIDMDPLRPKAIWGFNGTKRPAVCCRSTGGSPEGRRLFHLRATSRMRTTTPSRRWPTKSCFTKADWPQR